MLRMLGTPEAHIIQEQSMTARPQSDDTRRNYQEIQESQPLSETEQDPYLFDNDQQKKYLENV